MQVAVGAGEVIWDTMSLPLGAARLAARFLDDDPPTAADEALLHAYVEGLIAPALPRTRRPIAACIGVGGTLRRLPQILGAQFGERLPLTGLEEVLADLRARPAAALAAAAGIEPERARLLLPAILVLREVLRGYYAPPLVVAEYGIREGAVLWLARHEAI